MTDPIAPSPITTSLPSSSTPPVPPSSSSPPSPPLCNSTPINPQQQQNNSKQQTNVITTKPSSSTPQSSNSGTSKLHQNMMILKKKIINTGLLIDQYEDTKKKLSESVLREQELMKQARSAIALTQLHKVTVQQLEHLKKECEEQRRQLKNCAELNKEMESLKQQLSQKSGQCESLLSDLNKLRVELQNERGSTVAIRRKVVELEQRSIERLRIIGDKDAELQQMKQEYENMRLKSVKSREIEAMLESAQNELEIARKEIFSLRSQDPETYQRQSSKVTEIYHLNQRIQQLEVENSNLTLHIDDFNEQKEKLIEKHRSQMAEIRKENRRLARTARDGSSTSENVSNQALLRSLEELKKQNESLMTANSHLSKKVQQMEHKNTKNNVYNEQLQSKNKKHKRVKEQLAMLRNIFLEQIQPILLPNDRVLSGSGTVTPAPPSVIQSSPRPPAPVVHRREVVPPPQLQPQPQPLPQRVSHISDEISIFDEETGFGGDEVVTPIEPIAKSIPAPRKQISPAVAKALIPPAPTTHTTQEPVRKRKRDESQNQTVAKKAKPNQVNTPDIPSFSMERKGQEKAETYVSRMVVSFIESYTSIISKTEETKTIHKVYRLCKDLCSTIWSVCLGNDSSYMGSQTGIRAIVRGLCEALINHFILPRTNGLHIDMLHRFVILLHISSPSSVDIFKHVFDLLQSHLFPVSGSKLIFNENEVTALCSVVGLLSQIDTQAISRRSVSTEKQLAATMKPFCLAQATQVLCVDLLCASRIGQPEDQYDEKKLEQLLFVVASNNKLIQMNNFMGKTMVAILSDIETEDDSRLQNIIHWILKVIGINSTYSKDEDHIDRILGTMVSAIKTLSLTTLGDSSKDQLTLSRIEQDIIHSFAIIVHFRNDWNHLYNDIYVERIWPLVHGSGAMNVTICITGILLTLKARGIISCDYEPEQHIRDMIQKFLIVLDPDTRADFGLLVQMYAVDYLTNLVCSNSDKTIQQSVQDLNVQYHLLTWLDRHQQVKEFKELDMNFPYLFHLVVFSQQLSTVVPRNDPHHASNTESTDPLDDMWQIKWKK